ncbi:MAG: acetate--CoA ligase family protein, partial [Chloroflexi bacterium]|nr:acetate--CoA ligase family protein [Chloroflexota bacterium]
MRFYEFEAKQLLAKQRIPTGGGGVASTAEEAERIAAEAGGPVVLKSQVLAGGRMKAGGVKFADTPAEAKSAAADILVLEIAGQLPKGVLVEAKAQVKHEYYLGVTYDAIAKLPIAIFSDMGGIDIEEVAEQHPDHLSRTTFSNLRPFSDFEAKVAVARVGVTGGELNALTRIVAALARIFVQYDLTLAEITPIGRLDDGPFGALDSPMDMEA